MRDDEFERAWAALQQRLPESMRAQWIIVPRASMTKAAIACLLLGAAFALLAVGLVLDSGPLKFGYPAVLAALALVNRYLPWWSRDDRQLRQWHAAQATPRRDTPSD